MAKTRASRATSYFPVKIPIHSLSGGVGRQIPSKRLPTECEDLVNFFCTTESSLNKRNGTEFLSNLFDTSVEGFTDYHWLAVDNNIAYLFLLNSTDGGTDFLKVFKINSETSEVELHLVDASIKQEIIDYIRHPGDAKLEIINIGSSLLVLNPNVSAGFTTLQTDEFDEYLKDFNGDQTSEEDIKGADIVYHTSITVDNSHKAEVWGPNQDYTWGQQAIDFEDPLYDSVNDFAGGDWNASTNPYYEWRGHTWDEGRTSNPGGELVINFSKQVLPMKEGHPLPAIADYFKDAKSTGAGAATKGSTLGNSITLIAIDSNGDEQTIRYVWIDDTGVAGVGGEDPVAYPTGTVLSYTTTGTDHKPISVAVNTHAASPSYTANQIANGWADAAELKVAMEHANGHTDGDDVPYFDTVANQVTSTNIETMPGRIIIRQKMAGRRGNTNVVTNNASFVHQTPTSGTNREYDMNLHTSTTIKNTFTGAVGESDESINDTFSPTWDGDTGKDNYWVDFTSSGVSYGIWEVKTYLPAEELPGPTNELLAEDTEFRGSTLRPHKDLARWKRVDNTDSFFLEDPTSVNNSNVEATRFIPVEEYVYPSSTSLHLGQSVARLSDLKFPPDSTDPTAYNGGDSVVATLSSLYPDLVNGGKGKIYYLSQAYLDHSPGWYLVTNSKQSPYLQKVRAPGKRTVIDQRRMPMMVYLDSKTNKWSMRMVDWDPKHSGDEDNNRGPGLFFDPVTGDPKESKINTMTFYRDRLFLTNDDTVMASRSGDWDNFFLADPETITDTDPLDLMVASNDYTPIKNLIPFKDFLFVGTSGNTQYELMGSQNILSPLTASFAPSAFYPMLTEVKPVPMNNSLFFFAKKKMYIYFGQKAVVAEQAFELSRHVPEYLPESLKVVTPSSHGSMIFALEENTDSTQPTNVFVYRNQIANERVIQNAFFKFQFKAVTKSSVEFIKAWNKHLYIISYSREIDNPYSPYVTLSRMSLDTEANNIPRLDDRRLLTLPYTATFDSSLQKTTVTLTGVGYPLPDTLITSAGEVLPLTVTDAVNNIYTLEGHVTDLFSGTGESDAKWVGVNFTSTVELSTAYARDEANNIVPGTFNVRYCTLQTYNSHKFDVNVSVNNRNKQTYSFNQEVIDDTDIHDWIGNPVVTGVIKEHQVRFPLLGFNQDIKITITSDNPHPLNIASLQYAGKFKGITRYHNS